MFDYQFLLETIFEAGEVNRNAAIFVMNSFAWVSNTSSYPPIKFEPFWAQIKKNGTNNEDLCILWNPISRWIKKKYWTIVYNSIALVLFQCVLESLLNKDSLYKNNHYGELWYTWNSFYSQIKSYCRYLKNLMKNRFKF